MSHNKFKDIYISLKRKIKIGLSEEHDLEEIEVATNNPQDQRIMRFQINITPDVEQKMDELVSILTKQSPDKNITKSEFMKALVLNLYEARNSIDRRLPKRGRWGSASAKAYPIILAMIFRDAIIKNAKLDESI